MSISLDLHLTINIFDLLALRVSSFFSLRNTTNQSLVIVFVASLAMVKLKKVIDIMILLLIVFESPAMLSFGSIVCSLKYLSSVLHFPSHLSQIFFQRHLLHLRKCLPPFSCLSLLATLLDHSLTNCLIPLMGPMFMHHPRILYLQPHFFVPFE